jgi:recombination protein RecA
VDNLLSRSRTAASKRSKITGALVASGAIVVVVEDSVAALVLKAELEGEMGLRKLTGPVSKTTHA